MKFEAPYESFKTDMLGFMNNSDIKLDNAHLEAIAHTRKAAIMENMQGSSVMDQELIKQLKEEKQTMDQEF